ncbi:MAG: shikimate dehydrogenase [Paraprevotella sp.]|nr:shikimate dehydrogenase [Paraprevotella sp.]
MELYGLIGYPLGHSFSQGYFTQKFLTEQIEAEYRNFEIPSIDLFPKIIKEHESLRGLNVTIPYKEKIIPFLDELSDEAQAIGAVNVVRITREKGKTHLKGFNSDLIGFMKSIRPNLGAHHQKALILGTGGASKAVCYGLKKLGLEVAFVSRQEHSGMLTYEQITPKMLQEYQVIVNCSPCGMYPHVNEAPLLPYSALMDQHLLYDLVYNPEETLFLRRGLQAGATTQNGLQMLHLQAETSWDFWHTND